MIQLPEVDFRSVFETAPGMFLVLTTEIKIVAASDAFLEATSTERNAILGRRLSEVFPGMATNDNQNGDANAEVSINYVLLYGQPHKMAVRKHDIPGKDGKLTERYWEALNTPVFNKQHEVAYIIHSIVDVTGREQEKRKLKLAESNYQLLINGVKDYAIFMVDLNGCIASWNSGAERIKGYTANEVIGRPIEIFYTPKDIHYGVPRTNFHAAAQQEHFETEGWRVRKDGNLFWANIVITALRDENGQLYGYAKITRDITERKKLEQRVNHLAAMVEQSSEAIISRGIDQRLISWNKGAEVLFGFSKAEAIGKTAKELGFIRFTAEEISEIEQEVNLHGLWKGEKKYFHKNGSSFYGLVTANGITNEQGDITSMVFIIKDISPRKQFEEELKRSNEALEEEVIEHTNKVHISEKKFRALIENSNDIITLMDVSFQLIYRSPAATRVLGWTDKDMIGLEATKNIHPDDKAYAASVVKEVMASPGKIISTRFRMMHKKGHYLWLEGTLTNLLEDKNVQAILFNFRDITKRVDAEEKLMASEKQFRNTLDNLLEGIQIIDFNWRYIYVNDALTRYSRTTKEELTGHTVMEVYPGVEQTDLFRVLERCMKERTFQHLETEFVFPDSSRSDFQLSIQPHPAGILILSIDITKAKKTENELKEEQEKFARIAAASPGLIYSFKLAQDGTMSFPYASNAFEEIFGLPYSTTSENAAPIFDRYSGEDKEPLLSAIAASARDMLPFQSQVRYNHPKKGLVWLFVNSIPTTAPDGSILWHGVITDVTERKLTEDKINEQNLRLKTLSDNLPAMMLFQLTGDSFDQRRFSYVSNGVTPLTGRLPEEVMNDPAILYSLIEKEDAFRMATAEQTSYNSMLPFNVEVRCRDFKGERHWLNIISAPRKLNNGQVVWDGFHLDITEKKKAEQALKKNLEEKQALAERMSIILNTLPANIALLDEKGVIREVNDAWKNFARQNGFVGNDYCIGYNYLDVSRYAMGNDGEEGRKVARGIDAVLKNKQKEFVYEYACHSPKIKRWYRMVASPLQEKGHAGAVVMHIDISELRRLEEERMKSKIEEQKRITKAMIVGQEKERNHLGQELHDNINQILVSTRMLLSVAGNDNQEVKELIKYPMELLDKTIGEIRTLCHKMVTPLKNVDLEELIRDMLGKFERVTKIKTGFQYAVNNGVLSDELQLNIYRILQELMNNIQKYSEAKSVGISLKTGDKAIAINVTDDGKGFDLKKKRKGVGISNIMNRVGSFNGEVNIDSSEGKGCITNIVIPY